MLNRFIIIFLLFLLFSCGKSDVEKTESAIMSANVYLGKSNCQPAIDILEANGRQNLDAHYLKVLASAYACRAGFSAVTFFADDLALTTSPSPLGGTSLYSTSLATSTSPLQSDFDFRDMQIAIDTLLYAGGISVALEPTSHERLRYFTANEAADIDTQLLFMMLAQLGKYLHVYGNGNSSGKKGAGTASNKCFTSYNDSGIPVLTAAAIFATVPALCKPPLASSHSELATTVSASYRKTRLCQGVVLLNGILNLIPSIINSASGNLATQSSAITAVASLASTALLLADPSIGVVATTINQTVCEDSTKVSVAQLETYFAFMIENIFKP